MADPVDVWQWLADTLAGGQPAALLVVTESQGSSPGKAGFKMAVGLHGMVGTIGGGAVERNLVKTARAMLADKNSRPSSIHKLHRPDGGDLASGMICGGEQRVLIYPCLPQDAVACGQIADSIRKQTPLGFRVGQQGLQLFEAKGNSTAADGSEDAWYRETVGRRKQAFIVGGGHVGLALSRLLATLDFDISVLDERVDLPTMAANRYARQIRQVAYHSIADFIDQGPLSFVFVMTHGHRQDEQVLRALLGKHFAYLGVLGSRQKVAQLKQSLAGQFGSEILATLQAPMGLPIGSHTPAEIAVSIAAQVIGICRQSGG